MEWHLKTPLSGEDVKKLEAGDIVYISGEILTARDEAHARILEFAENGEELPFSLEGAVIYHCGPLMQQTGEGKEGKPEWKVVSAGPTTSGRMSKMTPPLLEAHNVRAIIGKGGMKNVSEALKDKCVYLAYTGGCAALAAELIKEVKTVHWLDLGMPEAVWVLRVEEFGPLIVGIDSKGRDIFAEVREKAEKVFSEIKS
ncbi:fumarate hydratase [Methanosarcina sp. KYL-1]|uniref:FumA C-terminus/TtdB family hydratase beta subunit n=1 Tax=Methanosarcina sp. KYL-1 TaxID=2602068 RepID=UPI0021015BA8|nr:FumA C-terminus/TtdB family hydratase beta subunit [Methanosarcina sp. KYL-1]MCQ1534957.1 fumarate hydratase [Methanosarcina sp. KYL-1]